MGQTPTMYKDGYERGEGYGIEDELYERTKKKWKGIDGGPVIHGGSGGPTGHILAQELSYLMEEVHVAVGGEKGLPLIEYIHDIKKIQILEMP